MQTDPAVLTSSVSTAPASDALAALLEGTYVDPDSGAPVGVATKSLVIAKTIAGREVDLIAGLGFGRRIGVVSDKTTHQVLGGRVEAALKERYAIESLVLEDMPHADGATIERLRAAAPRVDAFIAVGSGTVSDLTKYLSATEHKPYAVFATAPSMNGYVSLTASITLDGHKSTLPAQPPAGAFFDLAILAQAPKRMIRAGLGDSICRTTAQADWLLSHLLCGTPYRSLPFALLDDDEADLFASVEALMNGDIDAMRTLTRTLVLSGFGTAIVGSSAPASQAEHLVSHYIDMMAAPDRPTILHGEQIGVTTLSIARLQHDMLERVPVVRSDAEMGDAMRARYGEALLPSVLAEFLQKRLSQNGAEALNATIASKWDVVRDRVGRVLRPVPVLERALVQAGAPMTARDIHLERGFYETALCHAREIRNRFTVLDLAAGSGRLGMMVSSI